MKIHRFLALFESNSDNTVTLRDSALVHQIGNVLKLHTGEHIILTNGNGTNIEIEITLISKSLVTGRILTNTLEEKNIREVNLYLSILKKENFELVVQKATEIGVAHITPLESERTIKTGYKIERLETIMKEAVEQSGQSYMPTLAERATFTDAIALAGGEMYVMDASGVPFETLGSLATSVSIFIGPEGGWSQRELALAKDSGAHIINLGSSTLRAETAAIIASFAFVNKK